MFVVESGNYVVVVADLESRTNANLKLIYK